MIKVAQRLTLDKMESLWSRASTQTNTNQPNSEFLFIRVNSPLVVALIALLLATGCRSHVIEVTLVNTSSQPITHIIVEYPGASFGKNVLAPGDAFHYVIKPVETGALKIEFTNAQGASRSFAGPTLRKDQEGTIEIKLDQDSASANPSLM